MFAIPNTTIGFQTYDADVGRTPAAQTFVANQLLVGGYLFCSTQPVFIRLTAGPIGQQRQLPEFFLSPGVQGISVDSRTGGNPISKIEVRAATSTAAQFWGALATESDPIGPFNPASYAIDATGQVVPPPAIGLTFQQDGVNKSFRQIADFVAVGGVAWNISDDVPGTRALIQVPPIGVQVADAGQLNEQIIDFQNAGGITWSLVDDAANHRVKVTGTVSVSTSRLLGIQTKTSDTSVVSTVEASGTTIFGSAVSITADGVTPIIVQFYTQRISMGATATQCTVNIWKDGNPGVGTNMGRVCVVAIAVNQAVGGVVGEVRETPTAGAHTYQAAAFANAASSATIGGGAGGAGNPVPALLRVLIDN